MFGSDVGRTNPPHCVVVVFSVDGLLALAFLIESKILVESSSESISSSSSFISITESISSSSCVPLVVQGVDVFLLLFSITGTHPVVTSSSPIVTMNSYSACADTAGAKSERRLVDLADGIET